MRMNPIAVVAVLLVSATAASAQGNIAEGRKAFGRCSSCHAVPDPTLEAEKVWVSMIAESA